jgi:molybdopterin synthase catalytic subunit
MITREPIRLQERAGDDLDPTCGAVVTFAGVVRSPHDGREVTGVFYECYDDMAERELAALVSELKRTHAVTDVRIIHRVGDVPVGEVSLWVAVTAPHRKDAFDAAVAAVDEVKRRVPIWKKERYVGSETRWL